MILGLLIRKKVKNKWKIKISNYIISNYTCTRIIMCNQTDNESPPQYSLETEICHSTLRIQA